MYREEGKVNGTRGRGVDLLKLVDKGEHADLYKQLGEWIDKVLSLQKENDELRAKCVLFEQQLRFKGSFQRIGDHTYITEHDDEVCSRCADIDFRPVRLLDMAIDGRGRRATCPQCKAARGVGPPISKQRAQESAARRSANQAR